MTSTLRPIALLAFGLFGCQQDATSEAPEISDSQAIAAVKAAQNRLPPIQLVTLEPIPQVDKDRYNLNDTGCSLSLESDAGEPLVLVSDVRAMVRVEGEMIPLAADVGGTRIGTRAWQHYSGKRFALTVKPLAGTALPAPAEAQLRDAWGRVVFRSIGQLVCDA